MNKKLREGFTTGTAVAGAAKAGLIALFGEKPKRVDVPLPPFVEGKDSLRLSLPLYQIELEKNIGSMSKIYERAIVHIIKDGGDDPDATSGMEIVLTISCLPIYPLASTPLENMSSSSEFYTSPITLDSARYGFFSMDAGHVKIHMTTGKGVGIVTLPGLPVTIGEPAYNPEPRKQLCAAILEAIPSSLNNVYLHLEIPEGEARARKTLNPRLGILGGVSILGTHGVVRPYSHKAFTVSISQSIDVAVALGIKTLLLSTGRRSEKLLFKIYNNYPSQAGIQVADFAAHAIRDCVDKKVDHIIWGCFLGKLVKLSQGLEWTHASQGAPDMNLLKDIWLEVGGDTSLEKEILTMPTAVGAFSLMKSSNTEYYNKVILCLGKKALQVMSSWLGKSHTQLTLHIFSMEGEPLLHLVEGNQ